MKRASTKKVKAHPACEAGNNACEGHLKPVQPKGKWRVTSAAIISLAISIEASSLLLTRQSARGVVAEPVGNASTLSTVPAATVAAPSPTNSVEKVGEPVTVTGDVNAILKPKQKVALNRVKQKSNRLEHSPAELRSEESKNLSAPATKLAKSDSAVEKVHSTKQASLASLVARAAGGSISASTAQLSPPNVAVSQLAQGTAAREAQYNPYVQNLQSEIQKLREKYPAQQTGSQVMPVVTSGTVGEFRLAQAADLLQPAIQKLPPTHVISPVPATAPQPMAKAAMDVEGSTSLQPLWGRQVSPELPPLAAVNTYLPKPLPALGRFKGYMWPTKGVVTSPFGWRWGRMHKGIDIAAPVGTPIFAAAPGVVVTAGWSPGGYGNLVDIQHADGSLTRYAHNYRIMVQVGQVVKQGQEISEMGSSGYSTGPHCHFEVHPPGHGAVNPIAYLKR